MTILMDWLSKAAIPLLIVVILVLGAWKKVPVFDTFLEGAKEGLSTTIRILPILVGIMLGIEVLKASGAMDMLVWLLQPIAGLFGIPKEILPMVLLRPISGSASLGLLSQQLEEYGADSYIGKTLSVMMGSTETIFYTITVYFGAIGVKKTRFTLWVALLSGLTGIAASVIVCRVLP